MNVRRRTWIAGCAAAITTMPAFAAWPEKPLRMIVPYPPGGATDVIGRALGVRLSKTFGQPVVVDNRAGASGNIGAQEAARSRGDGHVILMGAITSHAVMATLAKGHAGFDLMRDFVPVDVIGEVPLVVVVNPSVPATTFNQLLAYAKAHPGKLSFASGGSGGPQRMGAEMLRLQAGLDMLHVPYKGSAPAMTDLLGGQVQMMVETLPSALPHIQSGKLRALAIASRQRVSMLPDLPTVAEAGGAAWKDFEVVIYYGVLVPAGVPAEAITKLNAELGRIMREPEFQSQLQQQGIFTLPPQTPQQALARVGDEVTRWAKVIDAAGIKLDE